MLQIGLINLKYSTAERKKGSENSDKLFLIYLYCHIKLSYSHLHRQ
jgi:hypothetical protein